MIVLINKCNHLADKIQNDNDARWQIERMTVSKCVERLRKCRVHN